jgi:ApaG protein
LKTQPLRARAGLRARATLLAMPDASNDAFVTSSEAVTDGIRVKVRAQYSPVHSNPSSSHWFFLYRIRISNEGDAAVQLTDRHWIILDGSGQTEEVRGEGVVGKQPRLGPGESFEYTSGCPLTTPFGSMTGTYRMQREDGTDFQAEIGLFELIEPGAIH